MIFPMLINVHDSAAINGLPETPGVYWLVAMSGTADCPRPIPRIAGSDPAGILYIGTTRSRTLRRRVRDDLVRGLVGLGELPRWAAIGHPAAAEYWMCVQIRRLYPTTGLGVAVLSTQDQETAALSEINFLTNYRNNFGEYPPFNQAPTGYAKYVPDIKNQRGPYRYDPLQPHYAPWAKGIAPTTEAN